jgi:hypothetical protein
MSRANALWGAPRIHGELLKLGFEVAQSTVARRGVPVAGVFLLRFFILLPIWQKPPGPPTKPARRLVEINFPSLA